MDLLINAANILYLLSYFVQDMLRLRPHDDDELVLTGSRSSWLPALGPGRVEVRARIPEIFSVDVRTSGVGRASSAAFHSSGGVIGVP